MKNPTKATQEDVNKKLGEVAAQIKTYKGEFENREDSVYSQKIPHINAEEYGKLGEQDKAKYRVSTYVNKGAATKDFPKEITPGELAKLKSSDKRNYQAGSYYDSENIIPKRITKEEFSRLPESEWKNYSELRGRRSEGWIKSAIEEKVELKEFFGKELLPQVRELFYKGNDHSDAEKFSILTGVIANFAKGDEKEKLGDINPEHLLYQALKTAAAEENKDIDITKEQLAGKGLDKKGEVQDKPKSSVCEAIAQSLVNMAQKIQGAFSGRQ